MSNYDDIINLPHPTSKTHPRMSRQDRAAQFSPFAALTGYDDVVKETARITDRRIELSEDEKAALDEKLQMIADDVFPGPTVRFTYFVPDERKTGGSYMDVLGTVKKINKPERKIILTDSTVVPIDQILEIEISVQ